jgi:hypothetical protein
MTKKKNSSPMKKLIPAAGMLMVSAMMLASSTYAWFSMNKVVTATGMQINATSEGALVISNTGAPAAGSSTTTVPLMADNADAVVLKASTHDSTWATYACGLKKNTNPEEVDAASGLEHGSTALTFGAIAVDDATHYYVDKQVYIASSGQALTDDLVATITSPSSAVRDIMGAVSIDFYYMATSGTTAPTPSATTYAGTLNLAGYDAAANDAGATPKTTLNIDCNSIPLANGTNGVTVLMRFYVDGALLSNATAGSVEAFINNVDAVNLAAQTITVQFATATP